MIANSYRLMRSRPRASLVTDSALAQRLQVSARMVRLWVDTGAWPLPRCARRTSFLFETSDVEQWVETGVWPAGPGSTHTAARGRKPVCGSDDAL